MVRANFKRESHVSLTAVNAFAFFWLMPRLFNFSSSHEGFEFKLITADVELDPSSFDSDLGITFSTSDVEGVESHELFKDRVVAIASPSYVAARKPSRGNGIDQQDTFLHVTQRHEAWIDWADWGRMAGLDIDFSRHTIMYSNYFMAVESTLKGQGVTLGWRILVDQFLARGELVQMGTESVTPPGSYKLLVNKRHRLKPNKSIKALRDWILKEAKKVSA
jgi:DNA-binding transcriptional LysR family regulator